MKLWLLTQNEANGWDTYDSMVVAAATEEEAKDITPPNFSWPEGWAEGVWASSPEFVKAVCIGEASKHVEAGVVLASYNNG